MTIPTPSALMQPPISIPTTVFPSLFISFHIFRKFHNLKLLYELMFLLHGAMLHFSQFKPELEKVCHSLVLLFSFVIQLLRMDAV